MKTQAAQSTIKITLGTLLESAGELGVLNAQPLRAAIGFRLKKLIKQVEENLKNFHEIRIALCQKYGTLNEETNNYDIDPEKKPAFDTEFGELFNQEVELVSATISIFDLGDAKISAAVMAKLDWLIVE